MLTRLKYLLNSYSDEELCDMSLWVNSTDEISNIIIDNWSIDLITDNMNIKINDTITKEAKE